MTTDKPQVNPEGLYTQAQAARALKIDRHTVKKYAENGIMKFRVRKSDGRIVIKGTQILAAWGQMYL
jgi:predicted site-specific integrase-resolvase